MPLLYRQSLCTGGPSVQISLYKCLLSTSSNLNSLGACVGEGESIERVYEDDGIEVLRKLLFVDLQAVLFLDDFSPRSRLPYQGLKAAFHSTSSVYVCWYLMATLVDNV